MAKLISVPIPLTPSVHSSADEEGSKSHTKTNEDKVASEKAEEEVASNNKEGRADPKEGDDKNSQPGSEKPQNSIRDGDRDKAHQRQPPIIGHGSQTGMKSPAAIDLNQGKINDDTKPGSSKSPDASPPMRWRSFDEHNHIHVVEAANAGLPIRTFSFPLQETVDLSEMLEDLKEQVRNISAPDTIYCSLDVDEESRKMG